MRNVLLTIAMVVLVSSAFAGCTKKSGNGGGTVTEPSSLDETATYDSAAADTGFRVTGSMTGAAAALTTGANGSAATVKVVDSQTPDDSAGALDKADFLIDAKEADGSRLQAELRSMTTASAEGVGGDFMGGVANNIKINGANGAGYADLPEVKAYLFMTGLARVKVNNETLDDLQLVQVWVSKGIRAADGSFSATPDDKDLELHVVFPGSLMAGNKAFPGAADGFMYYYFENVKLSQLSPADKATVGDKLAPPEKPNQPPLAVAQVILANGTAASTATLESPKPLNVTLDASNSTDPDGTIEAYSWEVKVINSTGGLDSFNKTSGMKVNMSFPDGGVKQIELRVIDDRGGIANTTVFFFVNYHINLDFSFASQQLQPAGAYTSCQGGLNCNSHSISVEAGATKVVIKKPTTVGSGVCNGPNIDWNNNKGKTGTGTADVSLTDAATLAAVGKWGVSYWFMAQAQCAYHGQAYVYYTPGGV